MRDFIRAVGKALAGIWPEEQERRLEICAACPDKEKRKYAEIFEAKMREVQGFVCTKCDCPLASKVFAEEEKNICPKWK